ncbi:MAG: PQQ-binding-like beta-propeller repeat protein [Planctomycetota bacterium]
MKRSQAKAATRRLIFLAVCWVAFSGCSGSSEKTTRPAPLSPMHWPQFRGPDGNAVVAGTAPISWDEATSDGIKWKSPVPLQGASTPVVCGNKVFLTGATSTSREVYCFDATTGELLWERQVSTTSSPVQSAVYDGGSENITYAANSVAMDGVNVYAIFGNGDIAAFDHTGGSVWTRSLGLPNINWGYSTSLIERGNHLFVQFDQLSSVDGETGDTISESKLMALKKSNGSVVWEKDYLSRPVGPSLSSPIIINADGKDQLITCSRGFDEISGVGPDVFSFNPLTGEEYWRCAALGEADDIVSCPVFVDGKVVVVGVDGIRAIDPTGSGDVSATHIAWTLTGAAACDGSSCVGLGKDLFAVNGSTGQVRCINMDNGSVRWTHSTASGQIWASPIIVGDSVFLLSRNGTMNIFRNNAGAVEVIGTCAILDNYCSASPAYANGCVFFRSLDNLYCVGD